MLTPLETGLGLDVVLWFQSMHNPILDVLAQVLDFIGSDIALALVVLLLYWSVDRHLGRRTLFVLILAELVNTGLKYVFQTPRPFMVDPDRVRLIVDPGSFGIPSGHVALSLAVLGFIVIWAKLRRGWWWLGLYTVLIAWSRMYTGAHYPQDVIIGAMVGLALVWFCQRYVDSVARLWNSQKWQIKAVTIVIIALVIALAFFSEGEDQQMALGVILGGGLSIVLEERWLMFQTGSGGWTRKLILALGGLALVGITYFGMREVFRGVEPELIFRTLRYGLVSALAIVGWPWLSLRLGWMSKQDSVSTS